MSERRLTLPEPAPGFSHLVGIHARLLAGGSRIGSGLLLLVGVALPIYALLVPIPMDFAPTTTAESMALVRVESVVAALLTLAGLVAFLSPEWVWRGLGPGQRGMLDALPVPRWQMRFARVVAGSLFPLFLLGSLFLVVSILRSRGWLNLGLDVVVASPSLHGWGAVITTLSLLTAYTLSSLLALRFGKVLLGWGVAFLVFYLTTIVGVLWGPEELIDAWLAWVGNSQTSPLWAITRAFLPSEPGDLPWITGWLLAAGGSAYWLAGRHDRP